MKPNEAFLVLTAIELNAMADKCHPSKETGFSRLGILI